MILHSMKLDKVLLHSLHQSVQRHQRTTDMWRATGVLSAGEICEDTRTHFAETLEFLEVVQRVWDSGRSEEN